METTLLEIGDEMRSLDALIAEVAAEGGDITAVEETLNKWFSEIGEQRDQKIDSYCAFIRELELRVACRKEESERLAKRAKTDAATAEFLTAKLKAFFEEHNLQKIETDRFRVSIAKNGGAVPLIVTEENPDNLPTEFARVTVKVDPDREKIRAALEAGQKLPFAFFAARGTRLSIK